MLQQDRASSMSSVNSRGDSISQHKQYRTSIPISSGTKDVPRICGDCPNPDLILVKSGEENAL